MFSLARLTSWRRVPRRRAPRWLRALRPLLAHPRSAVLAFCAAAVLGVLALSVATGDGGPMRGIALAGLLVGLLCLLDNVWNVCARHAAEQARVRALETAWLEAHIQLALLRRWVQEQGLDVETRHLANEELRRQMSLPSPPCGEDDAALA